MPYSPLNWRTLQDPMRQVVYHTDMYLFDTYGMLRTLPPSDKDGGHGLFSATLVLLCVIDGLAGWRWPTICQEQRFKKLIRCQLRWGPEGKRKWMDKGTAAVLLYTEFRNPLVHELAMEKDTTTISRPAEPAIKKWGNIPDELHDIEKIDALPEWNQDWPILADSADVKGSPRYKLTVSALYWAVKKMANEMLDQQEVEGP